MTQDEKFALRVAQQLNGADFTIRYEWSARKEVRTFRLPPGPLTPQSEVTLVGEGFEWSTQVTIVETLANTPGTHYSWTLLWKALVPYLPWHD